MEPTADELAGVVDCFDCLSREELRTAVDELAFKRGTEVDDVGGRIDDAVAGYQLVRVDRDDEALLAPGPAAFPVLPEGAADLPHVMDVPERDLDRSTVAAAAAERFREEAAVAVRTEDPAFLDRLLDVSYELASWGEVDVAGTREKLAEAREALDHREEV